MRRRSFLLSASASAAHQFLSSVPIGALQASGGMSNLSGDTSPEPVAFNLSAVPFSFAGSFLTSEIATSDGAKLVRFTTNRRSAATYRFQTGAWSHELFAVELVCNGRAVAYTVDANATRLVLRGPDCEAAICFLDADDLQVTVHGADLVLRFARSFAWKTVDGTSVVRGFDNASGYTFACSTNKPGKLSFVPAASIANAEAAGDSIALLGLGSRTMRVAFSVEREEPQALNPQSGAADPSYQEWMRACPSDPDSATRQATRVAWYLFWALRVSPSGGYTRKTILSSRRSLSMIWSWDNLFNAMAIVRADPALAWDQLLVLLDHQLPSGVLPDVLNDVGPVYGFRKPPIWAWSVLQLLQRTPASQTQNLLRAVFPKIVAYHRWWFRERDLRGDGVPVYLNGNDSGWDNASVFLEGWPVQSPDLLALLCLDAECLGVIAERLGLPSEANAWKEESELLLERFHRHFVRDNTLIVHVLRPQGPVEETSTSLLTRLPVLLGERLAPGLRASLVRDLRDPEQFAAPCGPASESLRSPLYDPDGYWRGPVWGPSTLLVCEGLWRCSERELAREFARRYRVTCARRADFRENYDARTGEGRYDTGMTWSASDFLLLGGLLQRT